MGVLSGERNVLDCDELSVVLYIWASGVCMCSHRSAELETFLSLPARMQYHCPSTGWALGPGTHVLAIGWTSCTDKTSARAGAERYVTRNRDTPELAHQKTKAAGHSLYLAMCLILVVLSQISLLSELHQPLALSPGSWTPRAGCGGVVCTLAPGD